MDLWQQQNQTYLQQRLQRVRAWLLGQEAAPLPPIAGEPPPALIALSRLLALSPFEEEVLLLCLGMELDRQWPGYCAQRAGDPAATYPTWGLALGLIPQSHWQAIHPTAALRRWRLLEVGGGTALLTSPLRLDERILHYLMGVNQLDGRLLGILTPIPSGDPLVPSHQGLVDQMVQTWFHASQQGQTLPLLQLWGGDLGLQQAIALRTCQTLGLTLYRLGLGLQPQQPEQWHTLQMLCEREYGLLHLALIVELGGEELPASWRSWLETVNAPILIATETRLRPQQRPLLTFPVANPTPAEQEQLWRQALGDRAAHLNGQIASLVSHFNLSQRAIAGVSLRLQGQAPGGEDHHLWEACRLQARPRLDDLAERVEAIPQWDSLILPETQRQTLEEIVAHVQQRSQVYDRWGMGHNQKGLGITALFSGPSGTGKTMAAAVLSGALHLDLYRIDLSAVVSKYIGETEKNLRQIFDAAEGGGVILLFDEADALFGKRSDVKDSKDRYANIEVSYLLQRMEAYRGLAILTTNLKGAIDQAFVRRIRFIVQFPFPDFNQRLEIWRSTLPPQLPTCDLDLKKLAKLSIAGGNIRNVALNGAFLAAAQGEILGMGHLLQAAKQEYVKMERPLTDHEVKGWVTTSEEA